MDNHQLVSHILRQHGALHFGLTRLREPLSIEIYKSWLDHHYHGEMAYLKNHLPQKQHPQTHWNKAQSAIVFATAYKNSNPSTHRPFPHLNIASYAQDDDYHYVLKQKMQSINRDLSSLFPEHTFLGHTDSSPILERDLAYQAGLGWFGKNSCLIDRKHGSFFFISEIITSLDLSTLKAPSLDHCGTCRRCIEACPTEALLPNRTMDATRCISYWTIESKSIPPLEIRSQMGDLFFGCDICQDVCPWNLKIGHTPNPPSERKSTINDLAWILTSSHNQILKRVQRTPLARAGAIGLKRNALIVCAQIKASELIEQIHPLLENEKLRELAQWTLNEIASTDRK